jgi:hypothetical protein
LSKRFTSAMTFCDPADAKHVAEALIITAEDLVNKPPCDYVNFDKAKGVH